MQVYIAEIENSKKDIKRLTKEYVTLDEKTTRYRKPEYYMKLRE